MSAELKHLADECIERELDFTEISPHQGSTSCDKLVRAYLVAASPDAILKLIAERDALYEALKEMVDYYGSASANVEALSNARAALALVGEQA